MILTGAFLICKALGVTWSWWWILLTALLDDAWVIDVKIKKDEKDM